MNSIIIYIVFTENLQMEVTVCWKQILCVLYFVNITLLNSQNNSEASLALFLVNRLGNAYSERLSSPQPCPRQVAKRI